ncbi:hypothetical protein ACQKII_03945 [Lysinibacillus sp. NPDC048646]|uniref:hypothetical protein n=1 Tax=Lysinibacillus sp. NPDC048646 TaxID=3390574 RepID=UPI003D048B28
MWKVLKAIVARIRHVSFLLQSIMMDKITPTDKKKLLQGKETRDIRFTWKSGKKGKAKLKLENGKISFVFAKTMPNGKGLNG